MTAGHASPPELERLFVRPEPLRHIGPFWLLRPLGQGGFAPVWLAEERHDGRRLRDAAVKLFVLPPPGPLRDQIVDEARALCRFDEHPNIVRFYALHRDEAIGVIGLAMQYVSGQSLATRLAERGRASPADAAHIGACIGWALAEVHQAGLLHRDVKPANVIDAGGGVFKLIDFGIAAAAAAGEPTTSADAPLDTEGATISASATLAGTIGYIAPECMSGSPPTAASDLYALGATLFELLSGELPAEAAAKQSNRTDAFLDVLRGVLPAPRVDPAAGAPLATLVGRLLDPVPARRPAHAEAVARELEAIRGRAVPTRLPGRSRASIIEALRAGPLPAPLASIIELHLDSTRGSDGMEPGRALLDLAYGVLRYASAIGLAALAAAPPPAEVRDLLRSLRPGALSWAYLLCAIAAALAGAGAALAPCFAFALDLPLAEWLSALQRDTYRRDAESEAAGRVAALLSAAGPLLTFPLEVAEGRASLAVHDGRLEISPWLPVHGGRALLPEARSFPGTSWRASDPLTGQRHDDPALDAAVSAWAFAEPASVSPLRDRPPLVGRDDARAFLERAAREAMAGVVRAVVLTGPLGIGRTRLVDEAVDFGQARGGLVLRIACSAERTSPLRPLRRALMSLLPDEEAALAPLALALQRAPRAALDGAAEEEVLELLEDALLSSARTRGLVLAVDDAQWADAQTLGLLRLLLERAEVDAPRAIFLVAALRNEASPSAPARALLDHARRVTRGGVKHLPLAPLSDAATVALVRSIGALRPDLEQALVRGSGNVPLYAVHTLLAWRDAGAIAFRRGAWQPVEGRLLADEAPGVAELLTARIATFFEPGEGAELAAYRILAAVALYGGGIGVEVLLRVAGEKEAGPARHVLDSLVQAGLLVHDRVHDEVGIAQELVRRGVLGFVRQRAWLPSLHRALLDVVAAGPAPRAEAMFLASGYERLGDAEQARAWLRRAMEDRVEAGVFGEAVEIAERLAAIVTEGERLELELEVLRTLVRARRFEDARARLARAETARGDARVSLRRRILRLEIARGLRDETILDPTVVDDAEALADSRLRCDARVALAGVLSGERAVALVTEAIALAEGHEPEAEFAARVLRAELVYVLPDPDHRLIEEDLTRALAMASASPWRQAHIETDLAALEAETGRVAGAIERLRRCVDRTGALGMRSQHRFCLSNLAAYLLRTDQPDEAASAASSAASLAAEAGDPVLQGVARSSQADALRRIGQLDAALEAANEAARLQQTRGERFLPVTLLRRAEILDARGEYRQALDDVRTAEALGRDRADGELLAAAGLLQELLRVRRDDGSRERLVAALDVAVRYPGRLREITRRLIRDARAWLAEPTSSAPR